MSAKSFARMTRAERADAVRPFVGRPCRITYRLGSFQPAYGEQVDGIVVGSAHPRTNGNSAGDLIVAPLAGLWRVGGLAQSDVSFEVIAISLPCVGTITPFGEEPA